MYGKKMYGKRGLEHHRDGGDDTIPKRTLRHREESQETKDYLDELESMRYRSTSSGDKFIRKPYRRLK